MRCRTGNEIMLNATTKFSRNALLIFLLVSGVQYSACAQDENPALMQSSKTIKLNPLPLSHLRLTGRPLKASQEADAKYLLELQPDRMLAFLRQRAGLKAKAEGYGGWDGPKRT